VYFPTFFFETLAKFQIIRQMILSILFSC